jgi:hypothetical protein
MDIEGLPEMPIEGLRITDLVGFGKTGMKASNTIDMELHNVQINAEKGPAFLIRSSNDLELDNVSTRKPLMDSPVIRIESSPGAIVRNSRTFPGTNIFLSTELNHLQDIVMVGNVTTNAKKITDETGGEFWKDKEPPTEHIKK